MSDTQRRVLAGPDLITTPLASSSSDAGIGQAEIALVEEQRYPLSTSSCKVRPGNVGYPSRDSGGTGDPATEHRALASLGWTPPTPRHPYVAVAP